MNMAGIRIRPFLPGDDGALYEAARESIDDVGPWLEWCHPAYTIEESRAWIDHCTAARVAGDEFNFAIVNDEGMMLGGCGLNRLHRAHRVANLGYWVRSSATGHGVATTAVCQLVEFAFSQTNMNRLEIVASTRNAGSQRVAERAGACREVIARERLVVHAEAHDAVQFSFVRSDFRAHVEHGK